MTMFLRRTFLVRYIVLICLIVYGVMFAGVLKMNQFPTLEVDTSDLDVDHVTQRSSLSVVTSPSTTENVPTPASVVAALRLPLSTRDEGTAVDEEALMKKRLQEVDSSIKKASTTRKPGPGVDAEHGLAAKLAEFNGNLTLRKANLSDLLKHVEVAKLKTDVNASIGVNEQTAKVVNPHPFKYILNNPTICDDRDIYVLAYVHTAPDHYKRRVVIRQTWGSAVNYDVKVRVVFFMGRTPNDASGQGIQRAVEFEAEQYGDIVQEDFLDTYHNLTYKGIAALKWIDERCSHARWILKTDDDIFVNSFNLLRHLRRLDRLEAEEKATAAERHVTLPAKTTRSTRDLLMCIVWNNMPVMREGKWKVEKSEWAEDFYPTYCSGSAFVMSPEVAVALHRVSYSVPFFWVDDFYLTGLLALRAGPTAVRHYQFISSYVLDGRQLAEKFTGAQWYQYIFSHVHDLNAVQSVWKTVVRIVHGELTPTIAVALPDELPKLARDAALAEAARKEKQSP